MLTNQDINIRDPFIMVYQDKYYMYGTRGKTCWGKADGFDCYVGNDLIHWEGPYEVFHNEGSFWADMNYWAPECFYYENAFYMFASFKSVKRCRGTQILKADNPLGPFVPISDGPITPSKLECLDGTLYLSKDGTPYIVFSNEWVQIQDGTICAMPLSKDLTHAVDVHRVLFHASQATSWIIPARTTNGVNSYVTDGPFLYRTKLGSLLMIWSSMSKAGYTVAIARSDNGEITGNWEQQEKLLFEKDGGHGMIFHGLDQHLYLTLHTPNKHPFERPHFYQIVEEEDTLKVCNNVES